LTKRLCRDIILADDVSPSELLSALDLDLKETSSFYAFFDLLDKNLGHWMIMVRKLCLHSP